MASAYTVYGLIVRSDPPLAPTGWECRAPFGSPADITVVPGKGRDFAGIPPGSNGHPQPWFQHTRLEDGRDHLRWANLCEFLIAEGGHRVIGRPLRAVSPVTLQTYLFGQVLSFALLRLGIEQLHATTVVTEGKAVALVGDSGDGKSTLAAACLKAGCSLLTDDLLVLKPAGAGVSAYPGPPRIKLAPPVARHFFGSWTDRCPRHPVTMKRLIPIRDRQYVHGPVPLNAIYVLDPAEVSRRSDVAIRRLAQRAAWRELTRGTFNPVVQEPGRLARQFEWASQLARIVPVKRLSYPRSLRRLPAVVEALVRDVTSPPR